MKAIKLLFIAFSVAVGFTFPASAEQFDIFLKMEGTGSAPPIVGESSHPDYKDQVDVASFKMGVAQKGGGLAGGAGFSAGRSDFKPLTIYKFIDKATPSLFVACAIGARYQKATLVVANARFDSAVPPERPPGEFFKLVLEDVVVTSVNQDASTTDGNGNLVESVELNYLKIFWYYTAADGSEVSGGFDLKKNQKIAAP